jgi:glucose-6-phosphate 1-epimerase
MPAARWMSADGACAIATVPGAHLVSWTLPSGEECLFVSERSAFEPGRAIRGGIPVVFPQFADLGPLMQHGFARTQTWRFSGLSRSEQGASAAFVLESNAQTEAIWPHAFRLELAITIGGARLEMRLRVVNAGPAPFSFTTALHTYLRVSDARTARLEGLRGTRYRNRGESAANIEQGEFVTAAQPVDRIYFGVPATLSLHDASRTLRIEQGAFTDTVVWNPGAERTRQMADMAPDGFVRMLCVEAAAIEPAIMLEPGAAWTGTQAVTIIA